MPNELQTFIELARGKGIADAEIKQMLLANGWTEAQIDPALIGLSVPLAAPAANASDPAGRPSISALEASLQHILLWIFTGTSTVFIGIVMAAFSAYADASPDLLKTFAIVELVTFLPFAIFFFVYLRRQAKQPEVVTGKVWSIITIVLHSIGLMSSLITFLIVALIHHGGYTSNTLVSSGAICLINLAVVMTYVTANFINPRFGWRKWVLRALPVVFAVVIIAFGIYAASLAGPIKADRATADNLVKAASAVHAYGEKQKRLPTNLNSTNFNGSGISYEKLSSDTYNLCADFRKSASAESSSYEDPTGIDDNYTSTYTFRSKNSGQNCFKMYNYDLSEQGISASPYDSGITTSPGVTIN